MYAMTINSISVEDTMTRFDKPAETETCLQDDLRGDEDEAREGTQSCAYTQTEFLAGLVDISAAPTFNGTLEAASHGLIVVASAGGQTRSLAAMPAQSQSACVLVEQELEGMPSNMSESNSIEAETCMAHEKVSAKSVPAAGDTSGLATATETARLPLTTALPLTADNLAFAHWHASVSPEHNQLFASALEELSIDLSAPPFADILPRLQGLHPMTRFEREE